MFFKKSRRKKEEQARAREAEHKLHEESFDAAIKNADKIEDPAEKVIALAIASQYIKEHFLRDQITIEEKAIKKDNKTLLTGVGASVGPAVAVGMLGGPIGVVFAVPTWVVGSSIGAVIAGKRADAERKRLKEATHSHIFRLEMKAWKAFDMAKRTVVNNVEAISLSPLKAKVLALPGISKTFSEAAAWHIITDTKPAAVEADQPQPGTNIKPVI